MLLEPIKPEQYTGSERWASDNERPGDHVPLE